MLEITELIDEEKERREAERLERYYRDSRDDVVAFALEDEGNGISFLEGIELL